MQRVTVFLLLVVLGFVPVWARASGFLGIYVGEPVSKLPRTLVKHNVFYEGPHSGNWLCTPATDDTVRLVIVKYNDTSEDEYTAINATISLAQAIKIHSLATGNLYPQLGYATTEKGLIYGLLDLSNFICYVTKNHSTDLDAMIAKVSYARPSDPVFAMALQLSFPDSEAQGLINVASVSETPLPPAFSRVRPPLKAEKHSDAIEMIREQADIVIGKGRRTLALIQSVESWLTVNENHPNALEEMEKLRTFSSAFDREFRTLMSMYRANKVLLKSTDNALFSEPLSLQEQIESKMRQVRAMGFSD